MNVNRVSADAPILCIDDFFTPMEAHLLFSEWKTLPYKQATIFEDNVQKVNDSFRNNDVSDLPQNSTTMILFRNKIWSDECKKIWHEGYTIFDIINYSTYQEGMLSRYMNGAFYHKHKDTRWDRIVYRLVTIVYYLNKEPKQFKGGSLILSDTRQEITIKPRFNRAVVFPCFILHEVEKVEMQSENLEDARFSLNYWMGFRS